MYIRMRFSCERLGLISVNSSNAWELFPNLMSPSMRCRIASFHLLRLPGREVEGLSLSGPRRLNFFSIIFIDYRAQESICISSSGRGLQRFSIEACGWQKLQPKEWVRCVFLCVNHELPFRRRWGFIGWHELSEISTHCSASRSTQSASIISEMKQVDRSIPGLEIGL